MSMNPVLGREELSRLPFRRWPAPRQGTRLVFEKPDGELVAPRHPYTAGERWWRGPRAMYVVDVTEHAEDFTCTLPCAAGALHFDAVVNYSWQVIEPETVVREQEADPAAHCERFLRERLRTITKRFAALDSHDAEEAIRGDLSPVGVDVGRGLRVSGLRVELTINAEQKALASELEIEKLRQEVELLKQRGEIDRTKAAQDADLARHRERSTYFAELLAGGGAALAGVIAAEDPSKANEAVRFMVDLYEKDQQLAIDALKVISDGGQLRLGDLDDAVTAAVRRFQAIVGPSGGGLRLGEPALGRATEEPQMIADQAAPAPDEPGDAGGNGAGERS
ncbi:CCDC90 family protein [Micromonospora sp. PLK6-60]|uniref:CCDC90 family protein n=1 Tax=Micromonospora sp. PLK6-60 TaxID=2873383 RepID=UPI001CA794C2|nr:CCDC90 family protein [Micromonospora sp. PLK6-60]MBY8873794.1 CCDC90 family protein [Micromonospora sp. PLK6-60]